MNIFKKIFGPSTLIAAAFIGPGTITTCTLVGVKTQYNLLWVMLLAIIATITLQEMSARLGFITQSGLGEALNKQFKNKLSKFLVFFLVTGAIIIGNAAYEAGNISGGVLGLNLMFGPFKLWPLIIGTLSFLLIYIGKYKTVEKVLIGLVITMSICFLLTAIIVKPSIRNILQGFIPTQVDSKNLLLVLAAIGTTIVPYNLFLHASTISKKWKQDNTLKEVRIENAVAIGLGGIISMLIIITSASSSTLVSNIDSANDLAIQMQPLFGDSAKWFMGIGLMAAGISSAITAPLAAAFAAKGLFGWPDNENYWKFKAVWITILTIGVITASVAINKILLIKFAQITNAILLPFIASYLYYLCNSKKLLGQYTNGIISNITGLLVILITIAISLKSLNSIFNFI